MQETGNLIYTVNEVVAEIRDRATRSRLSVLPYELKFKQPQIKSIEKSRFPLCQYMQALFQPTQKLKLFSSFFVETIVTFKITF